MNPYFRRRIAGFTLIELLIVIAIIAILAANAAARSEQARERARSVQWPQQPETTRHGAQLLSGRI